MHRYNRKPIEIGRLQRFAMDLFYAAGAALPIADRAANPVRVACIGAGPASLTCAAEIARRGHSATVYDARPMAGGLNTHGVAEYKLRAAEALGEVAFVQSLGVEIRCGENVDGARLREIVSRTTPFFWVWVWGKWNPSASRARNWKA